MFAYCNNNPVNMKDASGHVPVYIITNVETEEDEDVPNTYHTMITYITADTDDLYSAFTSNPQTVTFTYTITDGRIQMFNSKNEVILLLDAGIRNTLANAMINQAKTENNDSLSGRTTLGVAWELVIHAVAYKLGFMTQKAEPVDIGSAAEGSYGYDYNAALFENPILNIDILFEILGK